MSSETKWTPGPWAVGSAHDNEHQAVFGPNGGMVADCAIFGFGASPDEVCTANAKLIEAAPDLYAALVNALAEHDQTAGVSADPAHWSTAARAALAQARGDQP